MALTAVPLGHFSGQRAIEKVPGGNDVRDLRAILNEIIADNNAGANSQVTSIQVTAANLDEVQFIAPADGTIEALYAKNGATASATEDMTVDAEIGGTPVLTTPLVLDAAATTAVQAGIVDTAANSFSAGDIVEITRVYTAGTPTPITDTVVTLALKLNN